MAKNSSTVTAYQVFALVAGTIIGVAVLVLPRWIIEPAGSGALVAMIIGGLAAIALAFFWGWTLDRYPTGGPQAQTYTKGIGNVARFLMIFIMIGFFTVASAMSAREFGEVLVTAVLTNTPLEVIVLVLLALAAYILRQPLQSIVRVYEVLLPLMIFPGLLIALFAMKNGRSVYLLPLLGNEPGGLWEGSFLALASFAGMIVASLAVVIPSRPKRLTAAIVGGVVLGSVLHIIIVGVALSVFGQDATRLMWPTLELARITSLPGNILERVEALFLGVWVAAVFTTLAGTLLIVTIGIARMLGLPHHRVVVPWLLPVLYAIAMIPPSIQSLYDFLEFGVKVGVVVLVVLPLLMWVVYLKSPLRNRRSNRPSGPDASSPPGSPSGSPRGGSSR